AQRPLPAAAAGPRASRSRLTPQDRPPYFDHPRFGLDPRPAAALTSAMPALGERFDEALVYAAQLHRGQVRKGQPAVPYVSHLLGVASLPLEHGADEDEAVASPLHHPVEDQRGARTLDALRPQ